MPQAAPPALSRRKRRKFVVGAAPGTLSVDPNAPKPVVRVMACHEGHCIDRTLDNLDDLRALRRDCPLVWVNVDGLGDAGVIQRIGEIFAFHPLSLEDVVNVCQRPKVEQFDAYEFIVLRMVTPDDEARVYDQMSLFVGDGFVVTFQEAPGDCFESLRQRLRKGDPRVLQSSAGGLAYELIDSLIDHYFPVLEAYGERLEALEARALARPVPETMHAILQLKRDLLELRRAIWPLRDELTTLMRQSKFLKGELGAYLRDCYDHTVMLIDLVETLREIAGSLMDVYLSSMSNRMNEIMKVLTIIATLFMPLSFIAGIYGMNFDPAASPWNMPELKWYWGYPAVWASMLLTAAGFLGFFWRKGWLRPSTANSRLRRPAPRPTPPPR
jgi:magnesium transporter